MFAITIDHLSVGISPPLHSSRATVIFRPLQCLADKLSICLQAKNPEKPYPSRRLRHTYMRIISI
ncbi:hypothetical protein PILCRDRAFT_560672 [Piloderma croceum F 1598]|uniref:Uncharacterized protein n=1 Tax=Piloderma croceum (strain F 1598) TaxID=765440 RepID=A0A0C3FI12_PILCF|nr:hypothetical protein PILCRDRAFT_560672 [Piloderma croceum F 1598]